MSYQFAEHPKSTRHRLRSVSCRRAKGVTTVARSLVCVRLSAKPLSMGRLRIPILRGSRLKVYQATTTFAFLRRINPAVKS